MFWRSMSIYVVVSATKKRWHVRWSPALDGYFSCVATTIATVHWLYFLWRVSGSTALGVLICAKWCRLFWIPVFSSAGGSACKPSRLTSYCTQILWSMHLVKQGQRCDANRGQEAACAFLSVLDGSRIYTFVFLHKLTCLICLFVQSSFFNSV